mmetsp:Transcript_42552/g.102928  ORF Transcript_42552/g.102928 Transcript_42552/m.102928 type:complete len:263 (-) Transcript_42552:154-942(-)
MNRPKLFAMASPLAIKPMGVKSSVVSKNVTNATENHDHQPSTPRVNSSSAATAAETTTTIDTGTAATTRTVTGEEDSTQMGNKPETILPDAGNIQSLVFDAGDVRHDLGPPDENHIPSPSSITGNKRKVTGKIPVLEIRKFHAFRKDQMPVFWNISSLKPNKVTRHLRCLLLALESRPTFSQIRPQYYQLRDHFVYSYGFLHSTASNHHRVKLQALYKFIFDKLHALLSLADRLEDNDDDQSVTNDENKSEQSDVPKRRRVE